MVIEEPQVLVEYPSDGVPWSRRLWEAVWIVVTPERYVQIEDLSTFHLLSLGRGGTIPRPAAVTHLFPEPIDAEMEGARAQAARLAYCQSSGCGTRCTLAHRGHFGGRVWAGSGTRSGPEPSHRCSTWLRWTGSMGVLRTYRARSLGGGQTCGSWSPSTLRHCPRWSTRAR